MQEKYEEIIGLIDDQMSSIDLNGKNVLTDCRIMIQFIKEKLAEVKTILLSSPFENEAEEIIFFKYQKPMLMGRLMYFYKIFRIESKCPPYKEQIDIYYMHRLEELRLFFDRHMAFYQYYRSGCTHHDTYYFVRGRQEISAEIERCDFDNEHEFSTGYDRLVARIVAMDLLYAYLSERRRILLHGENKQFGIIAEHCWTGKIIELVELVYALDTCKCVDNGKVNIEVLAEYMGYVFGIDIKHCFNAYMDIKKRKGDSRAYFLDELSKKLNERMVGDDIKIRSRG